MACLCLAFAVVKEHSDLDNMSAVQVQSVDIREAIGAHRHRITTADSIGTDIMVAMGVIPTDIVT